MEADKENVNRLKSKTKIPLPVRPLPALPTHLLQKKLQENPNHEELRFPLRTINSSSLLAGPSKLHENVIPRKHKIPPQVNTRYVTLRKRSEDLDWDYKVFKDDTNNDKDSSIISISDDDSVQENDKKHYNFFIDQKQRNCLGEAKKAVTPVPKPSPLEPNKVRNIKRSLKRPHSRELQGLSPVAQPERKGEERFKRRLNFNERLYDKLKSPDYFKKCYTKCIERDYSKDLFSYLLSIERRGMVPRIPSITRACILNWLMKVNGPDGNPAVVQTAAWYLDSVLSVSSVQLEHLQPVAAACYWIAQKLHGPVAPASNLIKCSNKAFSSKQLMGAEKAILNKLKFPSQPVIPQDYITYLSWCSDDAYPGEVEVAATFLCMCGLMVDKSLCSQLPSVVAAACVRNALLLLSKRDSMKQLQMSPVYQAAEKKASSMCSVCSVLRRAVRLVAGPTYEYKAPLEHFGLGPNFTAQKVVSYANELAILDARCTENDY
ncbi:unnamed protein product, partial [Iphiclides podalirius]